MRRRVLLLALLLATAFAPSARALDEIRGVTAVWNDFVAALRRGDYRNAHGLFSPQSRQAMPYAEFVDEYGPLSASREIILAKADSLSTRVDGDWGEINYGGTNPATGRKFSVGVAFVRNRDGWGLVAARNETVERIEAGARALIRLLWENRGKGAPRELAAALTAAQAGNPVLRHYRLETDGRRFTAFPAERGLRTFFVDEMGGVRSVEETPEALSPARSGRAIGRVPQESAIAPKPPAPPPERDPAAMPELSDPGLAAPPSLRPDDWAEPPMPAPAAAPVPVALPDSIQ